MLYHAILQTSGGLTWRPERKEPLRFLLRAVGLCPRSRATACNVRLGKSIQDLAYLAPGALQELLGIDAQTKALQDGADMVLNIDPSPQLLWPEAGNDVQSS